MDATFSRHPSAGTFTAPTRRHLSQSAATAVPNPLPDPFRISMTVSGGGIGPDATCDSAVQAALDAACCDPPFSAVVDCPGVAAIASINCPDLRGIFSCCGLS